MKTVTELMVEDLAAECDALRERADFMDGQLREWRRAALALAIVAAAALALVIFDHAGRLL